MEELVSQLGSSASVSLEEDDTCLVHPRYALYKQKKSYNQEERRKEWLLNIKMRRNECLNRRRGLENESDVRVKLKHNNKKKQTKVLMLSVWLLDVPENMENDWVFTICPEGKRAVILAEKGKTIAYSRTGEFLMKFQSKLPGGCNQNPGRILLDCIWCHTVKTYFVLDLIEWNFPFENCDVSTRYYFLKSKFEETPELEIQDKNNRHKFKLLEKLPMSILPEKMASYPYFENNNPKVDGILFFHKDSIYTIGKSLLVTWLKPFMIPDLLKFNISSNYLNEIPPQYAPKRSEEPLMEQ